MLLNLVEMKSEIFNFFYSFYLQFFVGGSLCMQIHPINPSHASNPALTYTPITQQAFHQFVQLFKGLINSGARDVNHISELFRNQITILTSARVHLCNNVLYQFFTKYDGKNYLYNEVTFPGRFASYPKYSVDVTTVYFGCDGDQLKKKTNI